MDSGPANSMCNIQKRLRSIDDFSLLNTDQNTDQNARNEISNQRVEGTIVQSFCVVGHFKNQLD